MRRLIARVQVKLMAAREAEWHLLIAATALAFVFIAIMTGHVAIKY